MSISNSGVKQFSYLWNFILGVFFQLLIQSLFSINAFAETQIIGVNSHNGDMPYIQWHQDINQEVNLKLSNSDGAVYLTLDESDTIKVEAEPNKFEGDKNFKPLNLFNLIVDRNLNNLTITVVSPRPNGVKVLNSIKNTQKINSKNQFDEQLALAKRAFSTNLKVSIPARFFKSFEFEDGASINITGNGVMPMRLESKLNIFSYGFVEIENIKFKMLEVSAPFGGIDISKTQGEMNLKAKLEINGNEDSWREGGTVKVNAHQGNTFIEARDISISKSKGYFNLRSPRCSGVLSLTHNSNQFRYNHTQVQVNLTPREINDCEP